MQLRLFFVGLTDSTFFCCCCETEVLTFLRTCPQEMANKGDEKIQHHVRIQDSRKSHAYHREHRWSRVNFPSPKIPPQKDFGSEGLIFFKKRGGKNTGVGKGA